MANWNKIDWSTILYKKHGRITPTELAGLDKWGQQLVEWKCDCGKTSRDPGEKPKKAYCIRSGDTTSCGCVQREIAGERFRKWTKTPAGIAHSKEVQKKTAEARRLPGDQTARNNDHNGGIQNAKNRGYEYNITQEYGEDVAGRPCWITGMLNSNRRRSQRSGDDYFHNSIDRIDSAGDYERGNVQPLSDEYNHRKNDTENRKFIKQMLDEGKIAIERYAAVLIALDWLEKTGELLYLPYDLETMTEAARHKPDPENYKGNRMRKWMKTPNYYPGVVERLTGKPLKFKTQHKKQFITQ